MSIVIIYHQRCLDGSAAAFLLKRALPSAEVIPLPNGAEPPPGLEGKEILLADYCFTPGHLVNLSRVVRSIIILDHHQSTIDGIAKLGSRCPHNIDTSYIDKNLAGCQIAWRFLYGTLPEPPIISYIADNDLWLHKLPDCKAIMAALYEMSPKEFETALARGTVVEYLERGHRALAEFEKHVREAYDDAYPAEVFSHGILYRVWVTVPRNPRVVSEVGNRLSKRPFADGAMPDFAAVINSVSGRVGLRGVREEVRLDQIAKTLGHMGGGHAGAAAFTLSRKRDHRDLFVPLGARSRRY